MQFTDEQLTAFQTDGYIAVKHLLTDEQIATARAALTDLVTLNAGRSEAQRASGPLYVQFEPGAGNDADTDSIEAQELLVRKFMGFTAENRDLGDLVKSGSAIHMLITQLVGANPIMFQDMALVKPPLIGSEKPWHQDNAYFSVRPLESVCGVWIALDDAAVENGCMHVVPGGHHRGALKHHHDRDCEIIPDRLDGINVLPIPLPAGGALFFSGMLPHQTPPNTSPLRRRALQFHFRAASSTLISPEEYYAIFAEADGTAASCAAAAARGI